MGISIAENKVRVVACIAAIVAVALLLIPSVTIKNVIGYAISITVAIGYLFDRWLWRCFPEVMLGVPKIYGTWSGELKSKWINLDTKVETQRKVSPFFLSIRQTFSTVKICAITKESKSFSLGQHIRQSEDGDWLVSYIYDNTPDRKVRKKSQRHCGAAELTVGHLNGNRQITGEYWTDRCSQGELLLQKRDKTPVNSYEAACKFFGI
jgi:hypothetical protein